MKLLFVQTGGTIDKGYFSTANNHGYNFEITDPAYERILERIRPSFDYETTTVARKDSTELTDADRLAIFNACKTTSIDRIIVTHGTDSILQSAEAVDGINNKTIVFTGARIPEYFKDSDADFNLGSAISAATYLPIGVYIAMNGLVLPWRDIIYDPVTETFIAK